MSRRGQRAEALSGLTLQMCTEGLHRNAAVHKQPPKLSYSSIVLDLLITRSVLGCCIQGRSLTACCRLPAAGRSDPSEDPTLRYRTAPSTSSVPIAASSIASRTAALAIPVSSRLVAGSPASRPRGLFSTTLHIRLRY